MELRRPKRSASRISITGGFGHVHTHFQHGRADEHVHLARRKRSIVASRWAAFNLTVDDATRGRGSEETAHPRHRHPPAGPQGRRDFVGERAAVSSSSSTSGTTTKGRPAGQRISNSR